MNFFGFVLNFLVLTFYSKFDNSHKKNFGRPYLNFGSAFLSHKFRISDDSCFQVKGSDDSIEGGVAPLMEK